MGYARIGVTSDLQDGVRNSGKIRIKDDAVVVMELIFRDVEIGSHALYRI